MKKIKMFMFEACPHCKKARGFLDELLKEEKYKDIEIEMIDEKLHPEIADTYDYYYVPTFYVNDEKVSEGSVTFDQVKAVLDKALL
ncbi:glutaredoxin family protein [Anaerorhabdus sp.]|uniref:Thioredoxin-like fold domain-containing protein n=1 Tax=bioreactor metagenome TaxID=1076179 RepID=A0A645BS67_9ZZZZ|nr:thioredoxin family protein [Anaerorhabdus sp.]MEA4874327.1 thioredoxin family protein [Anaerorhabdus sp.]